MSESDQDEIAHIIGNQNGNHNNHRIRLATATATAATTPVQNNNGGSSISSSCNKKRRYTWKSTQAKVVKGVDGSERMSYPFLESVDFKLRAICRKVLAERTYEREPIGDAWDFFAKEISVEEQGLFTKGITGDVCKLKFLRMMEAMDLFCESQNSSENNEEEDYGGGSDDHYHDHDPAAPLPPHVDADFYRLISRLHQMFRAWKTDPDATRKRIAVGPPGNNNDMPVLPHATKRDLSSSTEEQQQQDSRHYDDTKRRKLETEIDAKRGAIDLRRRELEMREKKDEFDRQQKAIEAAHRREMEKHQAEMDVRKARIAVKKEALDLKRREIEIREKQEEFDRQQKAIESAHRREMEKQKAKEDAKKAEMEAKKEEILMQLLLDNSKR